MCGQLQPHELPMRLPRDTHMTNPHPTPHPTNIYKIVFRKAVSCSFGWSVKMYIL